MAADGVEMVVRAGVILLDLREYAGTRLGTRYELTEVLRRAPLQKVLVLVGSGDDVTGLRAEIESIWRDVGRSRRDRADSPRADRPAVQQEQPCRNAWTVSRGRAGGPE